MRNNCSIDSSSSSETEPYHRRFYHPSYGCVCERAVHHQGSVEGCDLICPTDRHGFDDCLCRDLHYAAPQCVQRVCSYRGRAYCLDETSRMPQRCEDGGGRANADGLQLWDVCPCVHGFRLKNGVCWCYGNFGGLFCQNYEPPEMTTSTTAPVPVVLRRAPTGGSAERFVLGLDMTIFLSVAVSLVAIACIVTYWQDRRRRRAILQVARWDYGSPTRRSSPALSSSSSTAVIPSTPLDVSGHPPADPSMSPCSAERATFVGQSSHSVENEVDNNDEEDVPFRRPYDDPLQEILVDRPR